METGKQPVEKNIIIVAVIYFLASGVLLYKFGIQLGGEAEKYIDNAHRILNGDELRNGFFGFFYVLYSLLVAFFVKFSINLIGVAVVQVVLSFFAALLFYKLLLAALENKTTAFVFFIAYLLCYPVQRWNFYLYSESLHSSLLVIGLYFFHRWLTQAKHIRLVPLVIVLLLILFSRPTGLIFLMTFFATGMTWLHHTKKRPAFFTVAGIAVVTLIAVLNSPLTAFVNPDSLKRMEIICQVPETSVNAPYEEFNRQGLLKAFGVIKNDIGVGNFFRNGFTKLGYFFGMYRSYYSWQNNLLLLCYTLLYPFALIGIFSKQSGMFFYIKWFAVVYLCITAMAIFFTCDDWANRFISPVFPFILILAAAGFAKTIALFKKKERTV
ncbi:MAG TPA: hypothetical protein PKC54_07090 [Ferruginibacter sp.]|nr:hypothetical protein [Ferruginibacter sp.]